jgi:hypothetical protein
MLVVFETIKLFVKKGKKNGAADAAAICEGASRPDVKIVAAKSLEQQGILALHVARSLLVKQETTLAKAMRGLAIEFGLAVPKGIRKLEELMALVDANSTVPSKPVRPARPLSRVGRMHQDFRSRDCRARPPG